VPSGRWPGRTNRLLADDAVKSEPVSLGTFPANREKNREIAKINAA
jgi:hypothetical protein